MSFIGSQRGLHPKYIEKVFGTVEPRNKIIIIIINVFISHNIKATYHLLHILKISQHSGSLHI